MLVRFAVVAAIAAMALSSKAASQTIALKTLVEGSVRSDSTLLDQKNVVAAERILPKDKFRKVKPFSMEEMRSRPGRLPSVKYGEVGTDPLDLSPVAPTIDYLTSNNYGVNQLETFNHYSDNLVPISSALSYPYRASGWFSFVTWDNKTSRCTATLISKSILLTAGHCVHSGGGGSSYYIKSGAFYPAYTNGLHPYGSAVVDSVVTTSGWLNSGQLNRGYDVALVVLKKRSWTLSEIGTNTGWLSFCYSNCLNKFLQNTQVGYPGNYYGGQYMTEGRHLEYSDGFDYRAGSGMGAGSSGGPHISNIGELSDSSTNQGQSTNRNVVFAVTSWGYSDSAVKIQGYSSTSGPNNGNNFKGMYNAACNRSRALHGSSSCQLLP